jgi:hypothetical protein
MVESGSFLVLAEPDTRAEEDVSMKAIDRLIDYASRPVPLRTIILRKFLRRWPIGSYEARLRAQAVERPDYAWCVYFAALEAKALGQKAMSVVEFGVAGGNGLVCLCEHKKAIERALGIDILVVGFDSGSGLPASSDPRDILYCWPEGSFAMNRAALEKRIDGRAQLVFGDVSETVTAWQPDSQAPLGAVMFDLDYYSSTASALLVLTKENVLPRVWCYFDNLCAGPEEAVIDIVGERAAISEFNLSPDRKKLNDKVSLAHCFKGFQPQPWHQHIYVYHRINHPNYNVRITGNRDQLQLASR